MKVLAMIAGHETRAEVVCFDQFYCCGQQLAQLRLPDGQTLHVCQSVLFPYIDGMVEQVGTA